MRCDDCGCTVFIQRPCIVCGKDLCNKCRYYDYTDEGDYPTLYCRSCWDAGEEYRNEIIKIENEADYKTNKLIQDWYRATKKKGGEMVIIQRRIFDIDGKATPAIGFYTLAYDRLVGALWDGERKVKFPKIRKISQGENHKYLCHNWEQVFEELGITTKAIRKQDSKTRAAHAWGWRYYPEKRGPYATKDE